MMHGKQFQLIIIVGDRKRKLKIRVISRTTQLCTAWSLQIGRFLFISIETIAKNMKTMLPFITQISEWRWRIGDETDVPPKYFSTASSHYYETYQPARLAHCAMFALFLSVTLSFALPASFPGSAKSIQSMSSIVVCVEFWTLVDVTFR